MRTLSHRFLGIACVLLLVISATGQAQDGGEVLTNEKVVTMTKAGLSDSIIVSKIRSSRTNFNTSTDELIRMKQARVSDGVISAMLEAANPSVTRPSNVNAPKNPSVSDNRNGLLPYALPAEKGAYLWDGKELHLLYQSTVPSIGTNFWRRITPFVKDKIELQLVGAHANAQFVNSQPTIIVSGLQEVIPGVPAYRWPYVKSGGMLKDRRIVGTYDVGGFFGSMRMVDNEIECEVKKVGELIYAITPLKPLPDGECGLVQVPKLAEVSSKPSFAPPIWDFGIYTKTSGPGRKISGRERI